jgi:predicted Zn-dependent protease
MNSLAATSFQEVRSASNLSTNVEQVAMLERVGNRMRKAVEDYFAENNRSSALRDFQWEFILIDDPTINAWAMPGGRIAFYTGILPICANEDGIAVVMGHEIAHAVANHGSERMSQAMLQQMGGIALATAMREQPETTQGLAMMAFGVGSTVFGILPYSRKHEYEADRLGLIFMAMAGYDPHEAPKFWERMMALSSNPSASDFLSTHPSNANRIAELNRRIPEAMKFFRPYGQQTSGTETAPIR